MRTLTDDDRLRGICKGLVAHGIRSDDAIVLSMALECAVIDPEFRRRSGTFGAEMLRIALDNLVGKADE